MYSWYNLSYHYISLHNNILDSLCILYAYYVTCVYIHHIVSMYICIVSTRLTQCLFVCFSFSFISIFVQKLVHNKELIQDWSRFVVQYRTVTLLSEEKNESNSRDLLARLNLSENWRNFCLIFKFHKIAVSLIFHLHTRNKHSYTSISDYDQGKIEGEKIVWFIFISKITHISKPSENVMKFVTLSICSLLNISHKYMKQLPLYFL